MIKCQNCSTGFHPNDIQKDRISNAVENGMTFMMLECPECGLSFGMNPNGIQERPSFEFPLRTPLSGSHGFISFIDDGSGKIYGCLETGAIWRKRESLFRDIDKIIARYPHRESFYLKELGKWIANPTEPENTDELIDSESRIEIVDFEQD